MRYITSRPGFVLTFSQDSFQRAKSWVKELQRQGSPNIVIALAGNKYDLASKRKVDTEVLALCIFCVFDGLVHRRPRSMPRITASSSWKHLLRPHQTSKSCSRRSVS